MLFDQAIIRFATSGVLISLFGVTDHLARRHGGEPMRQRVRMPRAVTVVIFVSVLAFYLTIRPLGGAWAGGAGNIAGVAVALAAMALRWATRHGVAAVRQPDVAARILFYVALPMAVGVPWGWLVLTLPAVVTSAWACRREDRLLLERHGEAWANRVAVTSHWVPRIW